MEWQGLPVLVSLRQGESGAWWSQKRLPKRKVQHGTTEEGGWLYTHQNPGAKMEILG